MARRGVFNYTLFQHGMYLFMYLLLNNGIDNFMRHARYWFGIGFQFNFVSHEVSTSYLVIILWEMM